MKALVGAFNQEKALVGAFSVIVQPVVEPINRFAALGEEQLRLELSIQQREERNADTSQQLDNVTKELESMKSKLSKCKT